MGLTSRQPTIVQAAYVAMNLSGRFVIVPLCFASVASGILQGWGTPWGLLRHYWVVVKLLISVVATVVLLVHMRPISNMAQAATVAPSALSHMVRMRVQVIADAGAALAALLLATALSVYKPAGRTRWPARR